MADTNEVRNVATYRTPILAYRDVGGDRQLVKLIACGDQVGKSPVFQYIDKDGLTNWDSQVKFTIIDPNFLPPTTEFNHLLDQMHSKTMSAR